MGFNYRYIFTRVIKGFGNVVVRVSGGGEETEVIGCLLWGESMDKMRTYFYSLE